VEPEGDLKDQ